MWWYTFEGVGLMVMAEVEESRFQIGGRRDMVGEGREAEIFF